MLLSDILAEASAASFALFEEPARRRFIEKMVSFFNGEFVTNVVIIHDNDMDGHASGLLLEDYIRRFTSNRIYVQRIPSSHGVSFKNTFIKAKQEASLIAQKTAIFIVDHSVELELITDDPHPLTSIFWIDHHRITTKPEYAGNQSISDHYTFYINQEHSTTYNTWNLFNHREEDNPSPVMSCHHRQKEYHDVVAMVDYYDLGKFARASDTDYDRDMTRMSIALQSFFMYSKENTKLFDEIFHYQTRTEQIKELFYSCIASGERIYQHNLTEVHGVLSKAMVVYQKDTTDIPGYPDVTKIGVVFHSQHMDLIAKVGSELYPDVDVFAVLYMRDKPRRVRVSFRTNKELDTRELIKAFTSIGSSNGGGHFKASGMEIPFMDFMSKLQG